jgi:hypothetical protein
MTTRIQIDKLRQLLSAIPQQVLVDAVVEYASSDHDFLSHFMAIGRLAEPGAKGDALKEVLSGIDSIFGDDDIPDSLEWNSQVRFMHVSDLIEAMLKKGMYKEVIQAAERCFEHVENLSVVIEPDTFAEDCYEPIIRSWILALHESKVPADKLAEQVKDLEESDEYGAFLDLAERFPKELGGAVLRQLTEKD